MERAESGHTVLYCPARNGSYQCKATLGVLPGRWRAVRVMAAGERATGSGGMLTCKRCHARVEVVEVEAAACAC